MDYKEIKETNEVVGNLLEGKTLFKKGDKVVFNKDAHKTMGKERLYNDEDLLDLVKSLSLKNKVGVIKHVFNNAGWSGYNIQFKGLDGLITADDRFLSRA